MTYKKFEEVPVWQSAIHLAEVVDDFTYGLPKGTLSYSKRDQIERASVSVSNNIAEGFERGTTNELIAFLYIARGSSGEVRSMTHLFKNRPYLREYRQDLKKIHDLAESCSSQLTGWATHLQNSEIEGPRHLTDKKKAAFDREKKADEFMKKINDSLPDGHPAKRRPSGDV